MMKFKIEIGICDKEIETCFLDQNGNLIKFQDQTREDQIQMLNAFADNYNHWIPLLKQGKSQKEAINPITNVRYYGIVRLAAIRIIEWLNNEGCYSYRKGVSNEKSSKAVMQLLLKEPEPLIDYLYGQSEQKRIQINGKGTKKEPYTAVWCTDYLRSSY